MITIKKFQKSFTQIDNTIVNDDKLSMQAIGLFCYIWSKPDDWQYYKNEIMKRFNCGKDALTTAINSLQENNYLFITQVRADDGKFTKSTWYLSDEGKAREQAVKPQAEKPHAEKSEAENQPLLILNKTNTEYNNIDNNIIAKKEKVKNFVKPTIDELIDYCNQNVLNVDPENFIDYYNSNGWKVGKNPMKDWQATAKTWHRNNKNKNNQVNYQKTNGMTAKEKANWQAFADFGNNKQTF
jgi:DNA-binding MarR family transcriptional regulator